MTPPRTQLGLFEGLHVAPPLQKVAPLIVDGFAGGGGASLGIERATGRPIDIALNHDLAAIRMHQANHPRTRHFHNDIADVDPVQATEGRPVELAWFSPDCTTHSRAKGAAPIRDVKSRDLAWVIVRWAAKVRPSIICMENVEEFRKWCPLDSTGQPIKEREGETFALWLSNLRDLGYAVEHRVLDSCDYGAPTSRKRLFLIARCDGLPIVWPEPTHGPGRASPYRTAAECMDFGQPCPSIFSRRRPLVENTLRRIAVGVDRFVLKAKQPFVVAVHGDDAAPYMIPRYGERPTQAPRARDVQRPMPTIVPTSNQANLVAAFLSKHFGGPNGHFAVGQSLDRPAPTITAKDSTALTCAHLEVMRNNAHGRDVRGPIPTVTAGGTHIAEVRSHLMKYHGASIGQSVDRPMGTQTTRDRFAEVRTLLARHGVDPGPHAIRDIGMRMLLPRELFLAQGFPPEYWIDDLPKREQVRLCGNSVPPDIAEAIVRANYEAGRERRVG